MRIILSGFLFLILAVAGMGVVLAQAPAVELAEQPQEEPLVVQKTVEQPAFLSALTDIPLMPGLEELTDESLVFDKPGGRIVEATAVGKGMDATNLSRFYNSSLPQLGWKRIRPNVFVREGEVLEIIVVKGEKYAIINFSVKPL